MLERSRQAGGALSERKRQVLRDLVQRYVREVRPVSSQMIASGIDLSSATVRNELAGLEEQGFLRKLHRSGGRVPTDLAYRFIVEELAARLSDVLEERRRIEQAYRQLGTETEALIEGTLDMLASMTGIVAWVSMPAPSALEIRSLSFVEVDTHGLLLVLVTGGGVIQSRLASTEVPVKELAVGRLAEALNNYLRNRSILEVDYGSVRRIFHEILDVPQSLCTTLEEFFSSLAGTGDRVFFSNALRLILQPEFAKVEDLAGVLSALQDKDRFIRLLRQQFDDREVQTIIGTENKDANLHECSLVLSRYAVPGGGEGTVGVLGPTRQHYERTLSWVKVMAGAVSKALREMDTQGLDD
ncbi:heat-inducible transcription repressor HrcA [bacterium]|nr:heat-inducible transcription repressor HrcA [bacterium]